MAFGGGYLTAVDRAIFHHGIQTAFNLINGEFPPLADVRQMKTALADLKTVAEGLAEVAEETKRLCEEETRRSPSSMIRPSWCSPMTKYRKTLACLAEDALDAWKKAQEERG